MEREAGGRGARVGGEKREGGGGIGLRGLEWAREEGRVRRLWRERDGCVREEVGGFSCLLIDGGRKGGGEVGGVVDRTGWVENVGAVRRVCAVEGRVLDACVPGKAFDAPAFGSRLACVPPSMLVLASVRKPSPGWEATRLTLALGVAS